MGKQQTGNPSSTVIPEFKSPWDQRQSRIEHEHDNEHDGEWHRPEVSLNFWDASPCLLSAALAFDLSLSKLEEGIPRIFLSFNRARFPFGAGRAANGESFVHGIPRMQKCLDQSGQESSTIEEGTDRMTNAQFLHMPGLPLWRAALEFDRNRLAIRI